MRPEPSTPVPVYFMLFWPPASPTGPHSGQSRETRFRTRDLRNMCPSGGCARLCNKSGGREDAMCPCAREFLLNFFKASSGQMTPRCKPPCSTMRLQLNYKQRLLGTSSSQPEVPMRMQAGRQACPTRDEAEVWAWVQSSPAPEIILPKHLLLGGAWIAEPEKVTSQCNATAASHSAIPTLHQAPSNQPLPRPTPETAAPSLL